MNEYGHLGVAYHILIESSELIDIAQEQHPPSQDRTPSITRYY